MSATAREVLDAGPPCAETEPVRLAVVGLGYWGPNLVRNLLELREAEVVRICDLRAESLGALARRYPAVDGTRDYADVLADESIEGVVIATPVSTHAALITLALEAGKHVFVEKPLAQSSADAERAIALAEQRRLVLMPGHTFLYSPAVNLIKRLIDHGDLGDIYFVSTSRVNLGIHQPDVSVLWDLGPHDFSILLYWLGARPTHVSAMSRGYVMPDVPDVAFISMQFPSGTMAHSELSWLAPSKLRRTAIVGSQKMVVYDDTSGEPVRVFDSGVVLADPQSYGEYRLTYRTGDILSPKVDAVEPLSMELKDFCLAVRLGITPRSSAALGLEVVRMIEDVELCMAPASAGGLERAAS